MQSKIRDAQMFKVPYMAIIGDREASSGTVSLRLRTGENLGAISKEEFLAKIEEIYLTKSLKIW
jgi:threonyl-tRNA synthetase